MAVIGQVVASPGDMAVGAHQHQSALMERGDVSVVDRLDCERQAAPTGGADERCDVHRPIELQQHETTAEEVERRAPWGDPGVR